MNIHELSIEFSGEELTLTNQRVLYWKRKKLLVLSDLHLGKSTHFRKHGIAMPAQVTVSDLLHLEKLINYYNPKEVIIVGDLIHAGLNKEVTLFRTLTSQFPAVLFTLVIGNHDRPYKLKWQDIGITEVHHALQRDGIYFSHDSMSGHPGFCIMGHIHPGVVVKLPTNHYLKFPCFVVTDSEIILPAFSRFTGLDTRNLPKKASCFAFYEEGIFEVTIS